jgi:hypothetical protein
LPVIAFQFTEETLAETGHSYNVTTGRFQAGTPPDAVEIMRRADTVLVHKAAAALTN